MNHLPGVPKIESPFFDEIFANETNEIKKIASDLHEKGYAVIDFPESNFDNIAEKIKTNLSPLYDWDTWRNSGRISGSGLRIQDAWNFDENVQSIASNKRLLEILSKLYGRSAWPFQTLNFSVGTQQPCHSDMVHFSSNPERFMCGVWVALEDITEDNGPLMYYPGSHKLPFYSNEQIGITVSNDFNMPTQKNFEPLWQKLITTHNFKEEKFFAKKGQALIWSANLLHGGSLHLNQNKTRWSQVTHYYFDNCAYYCPMNSDVFLGKIDYKILNDISTGVKKPNMYQDLIVPNSFIELTKSKPGQLPEDFDPKIYLQLNPDVGITEFDAIRHYLQYGRQEGRVFKV